MPGFTLLDPAVLTGVGSAIAAFITGRVTKRDDRISALETEVEECRKRDARFVVVEAGFRMVVGEMVRKDPRNQVLRLCGDLLNRELGPAPADFADLLSKIDDATPDYEPPFRSPKL